MPFRQGLPPKEGGVRGGPANVLSPPRSGVYTTVLSERTMC